MDNRRNFGSVDPRRNVSFRQLRTCLPDWLGQLCAITRLMQCSKQRPYSLGLEASTVLGRRIVKVEPFPGSLSTVMSPPII
jgi:hypothetical protein